MVLFSAAFSANFQVQTKKLLVFHRTSAPQGSMAISTILLFCKAINASDLKCVKYEIIHTPYQLITHLDSHQC